MPGSKSEPLSHGAPTNCFGCGPQNRGGLRLKFFVEGDRVVCRFKLAQRFGGPPGYAHGGIIATLLDEAMSKSCRRIGVTAMTRHMEIDYQRPVPLATPLRIIGVHLEADGRKHRCHAEITTPAGEVLARGRGLFIEVDAERLLAWAQRNARRRSAAS